MMNDRLISPSPTTTAAAAAKGLARVQKGKADQTDPDFKQNPLLSPEGNRSNMSVKYLCLSASSSSSLVSLNSLRSRAARWFLSAFTSSREEGQRSVPHPRNRAPPGGLQGPAESLQIKDALACSWQKRVGGRRVAGKRKWRRWKDWTGMKWTKEKRMRNKRHEKRGWEVKRKGGVGG